MSTYVLCHGGWAGGWQWKEVAAQLRASGHEVYTPTYTGQGERSHLLNRSIDLNTYIQDILMVLKYEELTDVMLIGYSMSGLVISAVAELAPERICRLVYLDAYLIGNGQSIADLIGPELMEYLKQSVDADGDGWLMPHYPPDVDRHGPMPYALCFTTVPVSNPAAAVLPRTFIYCTLGGQDIGPLHDAIEQAAGRVKSDPTWDYHDLESGHMPMWTVPEALTELLLGLG